VHEPADTAQPGPAALLEKKSGKNSLGYFLSSGDEKLYYMQLNVGLPYIWGIFSHI